MKKILITLILVNLASCAHQIPLTYEERCAIKGMKFSGTVNETIGTSASTFGNGNNSVNGYSVSHESSVQCTSPSNEKDKCEVRERATTGTKAQEWNRDVYSKNMLTYWGYLLIIPGIVLQQVYSSKEADLIADISKSRSSMSCDIVGTESVINKGSLVVDDYLVNPKEQVRQARITEIDEYFNKFPAQVKWKPYVSTGKVELDMPTDIAELSWGKPTSKEISKSKTGRVETWLYTEKKSTLKFTNGILESYQASN